MINILQTYYTITVQRDWTDTVIGHFADYNDAQLALQDYPGGTVKEKVISIGIYSNYAEYNETRAASLRTAALAKLTPEEKTILGLNTEQ